VTDCNLERNAPPEEARAPRGTRKPKCEAQSELSPRVARLHGQVLQHFLAVGASPELADLRRWAEEFSIGLSEALAQLAEADLIQCSDATGLVTTAYPFSGVPTAYVVRLTEGSPVYAMCAIDSLGIPLMAGRDGVITGTDPATLQPIRVQYQSGQWQWQPVTTAVLAARSNDAGPSAHCSCPFMTFHATAENAAAYLRKQTSVSGRVLSQAEAIDTARYEFAGLLGDERGLPRPIIDSKP
jgi:hypothetical protein